MVWREQHFPRRVFACASQICKSQRTPGLCCPLHPISLWGLCQSTAVIGTVTLNLCPALTWVNPAMLSAFPSLGCVFSLITS